jgi:arsenate reductase
LKAPRRITGQHERSGVFAQGGGAFLTGTATSHAISDHVATALFVCLHNAGRSQMSQALFERAAEGRHRALSAGTTPADRVHPEVVEVMREVGIELADREPKLLTRELAEEADVVVTMGCGDECPYIPGRRYVDWDLEDPKGRPLDEVRATRDDIDRRVRELVQELDA